jgi:hypothetical protein
MIIRLARFNFKIIDKKASIKTSNAAMDKSSEDNETTFIN